MKRSPFEAAITAFSLQLLTVLRLAHFTAPPIPHQPEFCNALFAYEPPIESPTHADCLLIAVDQHSLEKYLFGELSADH